MKLPVLKQVSGFIQKHDRDFVEEAIMVLEDISEARGWKEEELNTIGELISNLSGGLEVHSMEEKEGLSTKEAANAFMKRVMGSID